MGRKRVEKDFRITNFGVTDTVTGTSILVEVDGLKILFDIGGYQSQIDSMETVYKNNFKKLKIPFDQLDYIIISHSHNDHCALLPLVVKEELGFNGRIMTTEASQQLIALNIVDCAFVMQQECKAYNKRAKKPIYPLYNMEEAEKTIPLIQGYGYEQEIYLSDRVSFRFIPNGHLFGSASIYLTYVKDEYTNKHLLFTGDHFYGAADNQLRPFTKSFGDKTLKPNTIITEATYGDRLHDKTYDVEKELEKIVLESYRNKHILFIPAFAISRSTQIAYYLKRIFDKNKDLLKDDNYKIYMSGKMMSNAHRIIGSSRLKNEFVDEKWHDGYDLFEWSKIVKIDSFQSVEENLLDNKPKIIISSSGMISGGYSSFLAEHLIPRGNVDILLTGFQAEGTIGNKLLDPNNRGRVVVQGKEVRIKCNMVGNLTLSGHADKNGLTDLIVKQCDQKVLKNVIIIHGDAEAKESLKVNIETKSKDKNIYIPKNNETIKL